jgi:hypothetical protein
MELHNSPPFVVFQKQNTIISVLEVRHPARFVEISFHRWWHAEQHSLVEKLR